MSLRFEELDWQRTPIGEISLRRRLDPLLGIEVYEVKLGDEYLMSSIFTVAEVALATIGLGLVEGDNLQVVVGGLGLGYTARAVLADPRVGSLWVVEALTEVIGWQERGLLPMSEALTGDPRCAFIAGDFFALAAAGNGFGPGADGPLDAILVDIDHTPSHLLHPSHQDFYSTDGLQLLASRIRPRGVFALWSDDPPDEGFLTLLRTVFCSVEGHVVSFPNPITGGQSANSVYVGRAGRTVPGRSEQDQSPSSGGPSGLDLGTSRGDRRQRERLDHSRRACERKSCGREG